MKIKQSTFYAIRILCRIHREPNQVVTSKEIAEKEELSQGVVLKLLRELSHAGMVHVYQGRGQVSGGFSLAKSIDEITMADVVAALEGMDIGENLDGPSREKEPVLEPVCNQINRELKKLFSRYSIGHLQEEDEKVYQIGAG